VGGSAVTDVEVADTGVVSVIDVVEAMVVSTTMDWSGTTCRGGAGSGCGVMSACRSEP
jgi:hypothetical protein